MLFRSDAAVLAYGDASDDITRARAERCDGWILAGDDASAIVRSAIEGRDEWSCSPETSQSIDRAVEAVERCGHGA